MGPPEQIPNSPADVGLPFWRFAIRALIGGLVILVAIWLGAICVFGSTQRALAAVHGDEAIIEAASLSGDSSSAVQSISIVVGNLSSDELTILGAESSCGCLSFDGLPAKISPYGRCVIHARDRPVNKRTVASKVLLYTTSRVNPQLVALVPP